MNHRHLGYLLLLLTTLLGCATPSPQSATVAKNSRNFVVEPVRTNAQKLALVIGNEDYPEAPLTNPLNDARDMAKTLTSLGFEVMHYENQTKEKMERVTREFGDRLRNSQGIGLFYFAGHGMQLAGKNYLVPVNSGIQREDEVEYHAFDVNQVLSKMESAKNNLNLVILDACRDNPFARSFRSANPGGFSFGDAPSGTLIAYAAKSGMRSQDGTRQNGLYTEHLLKYLATPGLKITDLLITVRNEVKSESEGKQIPWEESGLESNFCFAGCMAGPVPTPLPTPTPEPSPVYTPPSAPVPTSRPRVDYAGIEMLDIQPGCFQMGSPASEAGRIDSEQQHQVCLTTAYAIGKTEVTQGQWRQVMGNNPSSFKNCGDNCPVEQVSWNDVQTFIQKLNAQTEGGYRLPTEAEWEYAARGGDQRATYNGELNILGDHFAPQLDGIAWYGGNSGVSYQGGYDCSSWPGKQYPSSQCGPHPVATKRANAYGVYDMLGNVLEWTCSDWNQSYTGNEQGCSNGGADRVGRGGSWGSLARGVRAAFRSNNSPDYRSDYIGFRLARTR